MKFDEICFKSAEDMTTTVREIIREKCLTELSVQPPATSFLTPTLVEKPTFKRKSNEEQFKQSVKVYSKLQEAKGTLILKI